MSPPRAETTDLVDVAAYLARLQLEAEPPSAEALMRIHRAQVEHVPYETTWIHMGERWSVDRAASLHRVAHQQRGGYCFHLNGAFSLLLESLGYDVTLHVGGVYGPDGPVAEAMDNHLVLLVHGLSTDDNPTGDWYVDAGLGDALHEPMTLSAHRARQGPFEFGLATSEASFADWHLTHHPLGSFPGMVFDAAPITIDSFASRNVTLSTSPESGFVKTVTIQRRDANGCDIMRGKVLRRVEGSVTSERTLVTRTEWFEALGDLFALPLDDVSPEALDSLWRRVEATHEAWLASQGTQLP